jgi:hypothetical protein
MSPETGPRAPLSRPGAAVVPALPAPPLHAPERPQTAITRRTVALVRYLTVVLGRYIVFSGPEQKLAVALWVMHTYTFGIFDTTPYLSITSAAKRCGKSRLLELLSLLVARPWYVAEPSEAALFRKVSSSKPTLLVDEVDATFAKDSAATEGLRAIYNAGYRAGAVVPRCVGQAHEVRDFEVFCPKAYAGIKALPDTVADRSVPIVLRRRTAQERTPARFRLGPVGRALEPARKALEAWGEEAEALLAEAKPALPDELSDRAQDAWEPLLAIADLAGARWAERARRAALGLCQGAEEQDLGVLLLGHMKDAFGDSDKMATGDLLDRLVNRGDDSPWARWWADDIARGATKAAASSLARLLKPFEVHPTQVWIAGAKHRGYERTAFEPAWQRYCPTKPDVSSTVPSDGRTVDRMSEATSALRPSEGKDPPDQDSTVLPFSPPVGGPIVAVGPVRDLPLGTVRSCRACRSTTVTGDDAGPLCQTCAAGDEGVRC